MTQQNKERIEKDALYYAHKDSPGYRGYIAGATAEHERLKDTRLYSQEVIDSYEEQLKQERNKAIELINAAEGLVQWCKSVYQTPDEYYQVKKALESLKH